MAAGPWVLFSGALILLQILLSCNKKKKIAKNWASDGTKLLISCSVTSNSLSQIIDVYSAARLCPE